MRAIIGPIVLAAAAALASCTSSSDVSAPSVVLDGTPVPITRLRSEPYSFTYSSAMDAPQRLVIRDEAAWQAAWTQIWLGRAPTPALPAVDFSKQMVIVAALGSRSTGGYGILVDSAAMSASGLAVRVRSSSPGRTCGVTEAFTQPVDIALLPRFDGPVRFAEVSEVHDCG